jgi:acetyl esterase/lipase
MTHKLLTTILLIFTLTNCSSNNTEAEAKAPAYAVDTAINLKDVAYGSDPGQIMDVYLPANRTGDTKVIIMVHGGAWVRGSKEDFADFVPVIKAQFPNYALVNINYRLATNTSPAFPKQIEDLQNVIAFLKDNRYDYTVDNNYAFIGASAGAHLAMLYGYKYDTSREVSAICNIVGPADFLDPAYTAHPLYGFAAQSLLGTTNVTDKMIAEVSPVAHVTSQAPPTIMFYGGVDPLIPSSQGPRLKAALDAAGVYNEYNFYAGGGHGDWDAATMTDVYTKLAAFLNSNF